jgi:hypothetical protein
MKSGGLVALVTLALAWAWVDPAVAQNDWQFPDPYFGILEIEKSRPQGGGPRMQVQARRLPDVGSGAVSRPAWARRRPWRPAAASTRPAPKSAAGGQR